jgi:hypothetical protein
VVAVSRAVVIAALGGQSRADMIRSVAETLNGELDKHTVTYVDTALVSYDRRVSWDMWEAAGIDKFLYRGPMDVKTRAWCEARVGKTFTREQVEAMDNGTRLEPVSVYGGGWNCRHVWTPVVGEGSSESDTLTVSGMEFSADRDIQPAVRSAFSAIQSVHELPRIKPVEIVSDPRMGVGGAYRWNKETGLPVDIRLNPKGDHVELTALLEIGHWLDHQGIGIPGQFSSRSHPLLADWRRAVDTTKLTSRLEDMAQARSLPWRFPDGRVRNVDIRDRVAELLEPEELFSRSYAQYVAGKSGNSTIRRQIAEFSNPSRSVSIVPSYWEQDDFGVVTEAIESVIFRLGWRK